jgi:outer membrane biosynthesis protein TonB
MRRNYTGFNMESWISAHALHRSIAVSLSHHHPSHHRIIALHHRKASIIPIRSNSSQDTARAFAEAFAQFGNNQEEEEEEEQQEEEEEEEQQDKEEEKEQDKEEEKEQDEEEEKEQDEEEEEKEQDEEEEEKEQDKEQQPEAPDPPPSPPPPPIDVEEEEEAEVGENEDEDDARAEAIQIAAEEFDGWWALRAAEGADDDEAQLEVNNITLDTVRDGVVSKKTLDMYAHESLNFLSWCLTNRPIWVTGNQYWISLAHVWWPFSSSTF